MKKDDCLLLMTACINPDGMPHTVIQNANIRLVQYQRAIDYYLRRTKSKIVFVENSGYDISGLYQDAIHSGRLEVITFNGNDYDHSLGKGYGESLVIETALKKSKLLTESQAVIKVSGRHIVKNLKSICFFVTSLVASHSFVVCEINKKTRGANSDLFIATIDFYKRLVANKQMINESEGIWFEHVLYETVESYCKSGGEFQFLPIPLNQEGQSGSMGSAFTRPPLRMYLLDAVKAFLYKFNILKVV